MKTSTGKMQVLMRRDHQEIGHEFKTPWRDIGFNIFEAADSEKKDSAVFCCANVYKQRCIFQKGVRLCKELFFSYITDNEPVYAGEQRSVSRLMQWPCQIKLLPTQAEFYDGAKLLIAADCTAYAYANMHEDFMKGKITLIGCPKLDDVDYTEKLTGIIKGNDIKSVTVVRMEVPCCGGLQRAAENALKNSGKFIPWQVVTISRNGDIID